MRKELVAAVACSVALCCDNPTAPSTGGIVLEIDVVAALRSANIRISGVGRPEQEVRGHLDSARVFIGGPTTVDPITVTPGVPHTVENLKSGDYTLDVEGWAANAVDFFGSTTATVEAGLNTSVQASLTPFFTTLDSIASPSRSATVPVTFSPVAGAASHEIEADTNALFPNPVTQSVAQTNPTLTVSTVGPNFVRLRAITDAGSGGTWSNTESFSVFIDTVLVAPAVDTLTSPNDTVTFVADAQDIDGNSLAGVSFSWISTNTNVATVDANGLATTVGPGVAIIRARATSGAAGVASLLVR